MTLAVAWVVTRAQRRLSTCPPPGEQPEEREGFLGEAMKDVLALVWMPVVWLAGRWAWFGRQLEHAEKLYRGSVLNRVAGNTWFSPRVHPWRFVSLVGLAAGAMLLAARLLWEGPPPDLGGALLVVLIFTGVELAAVLAGFAFLGGLLGLRPPLLRRRRAGCSRAGSGGVRISAL